MNLKNLDEIVTRPSPLLLGALVSISSDEYCAAPAPTTRAGGETERETERERQRERDRERV